MKIKTNVRGTSEPKRVVILTAKLNGLRRENYWRRQKNSLKNVSHKRNGAPGRKPATAQLATGFDD